MASPTATELEAQLKNAVALLENLASANTIVNDLNTYEQSLESDYIVSQITAASQVRASVSSALGAASSVLEPILRAYVLHVADEPATGSTNDIIDRVYRYFVDNSKTIKERAITYGAASAAGGNTGNGTVRRLTKDADAMAIEAEHAEAKSFECLQDANTGARLHEEVFEVEGAAAGRDELSISGSGSTTQLRVQSSNDSMLNNATFSQYAIAGSVAAGAPYTLVSGDVVTDWTIATTTSAALTVDAADIYRSVEGDTTPTALRFLGNNTITQTFETANLNLQRFQPYDVLVPIKRESSADGNYRINFGAATTGNVAVSTLSAGWNAVFMSLDEGSWPRYISETAADFMVQWSGRSTGTLVFDEITLIAMSLFDGTWWSIHGGTVSFLARDRVTFTDSISSDSKIQKWLWRSFDRYLPHAASPTITDP